MTTPNILTPQQMKIWGWRFDFSVRELRRAYREARASSDRERNSVDKDWAALEAEVAAGRAAFTETKEDGELIFDHGDHAGDRIANLEAVLDMIRQAFTIALHHLWERELGKRLPKGDYKEPTAIAFLKANGLAPDESELAALRLTANVAKHSAGGSADKLFALRPGLFDPESAAEPDFVPGHEHLRIGDEDLERFFEAVFASGPKRNRP